MGATAPHMPLPAGLLSTGRRELCDWRRKQGKCQDGGVRDRELARDVPLGIFGGLPKQVQQWLG